MNRKEIVEHLWSKSDKHRGKRLAAWANDADGKKERAKRWEAVNKFADQHASAMERRGLHWRRRLRIFRKLRRWAGGISERIRRAIRRRKHRRQHESSGLGGVDVNLEQGAPHWGGGGDVIAQFVIPFMNQRGLPTGSGKRTPAYNASIGGSPNSDHLTTHLTTDARDFPTYEGEDDARALAQAMGISSWAPNSYSLFWIEIDGHQFHVQILWGSGIGHGDHVHVGIGR